MKNPKNKDNKDDSQYQNLIKEAIEGSKIALEKIIKKEQKNIWLTLFYLKKDPLEIQDIMQDVLIKISKKITQLKNPILFKSWLNQIIVNSFYDYIRKKKKAIVTTDIDNNTLLNLKDNDYSNPQNKLLNRELDRLLKTTIVNLPDIYKIPITLRELSGLSYSEISKITSTTVGTVKSRISRARTMIKDELKKYDTSFK